MRGGWEAGLQKAGDEGVQEGLLGEVCLVSFWGDPSWIPSTIASHCKAPQAWAWRVTGSFICLCPD